MAENLMQLSIRWQREAEETTAQMRLAGLPENAVSQQGMRLLVLQWVAEIEAAKRVKS